MVWQKKRKREAQKAAELQRLLAQALDVEQDISRKLTAARERNEKLEGTLRQKHKIATEIGTLSTLLSQLATRLVEENT